MPKVEQLADHTDSARLSQLRRSKDLVIMGNLIFDTSPLGHPKRPPENTLKFWNVNCESSSRTNISSKMPSYPTQIERLGSGEVLE